VRGTGLKEPRIGSHQILQGDSVPAPLLRYPASLFEPDERLVPLFRKGSIWYEQYQKLRVAVLNAAKELQVTPKVLLVTSALPSEGKTLTAVNLSLILQRSGSSRVLLVEADLRKPRIRDFLRNAPESGLAEILSGKVSTEEILEQSRGSDLRILTAGKEASNPVELLESPKWEEILTKVRESYDHIIIDAPPWLPFPDAAILSERADGVLFVVRIESTPRDAVLKCLETLDRRRLLGVVANDIQDDDLRQYYRYYNYK